jgi:hypothetical protein
VSSPDEFRREESRSADWYDLIVVAMRDQRGHVNLLKTFRKVRFAERLDAVNGSLESRQPTSERPPELVSMQQMFSCKTRVFSFGFIRAQLAGI